MDQGPCLYVDGVNGVGEPTSNKILALHLLPPEVGSIEDTARHYMTGETKAGDNLR
jgi:hypothetical protein